MPSRRLVLAGLAATPIAAKAAPMMKVVEAAAPSSHIPTGVMTSIVGDKIPDGWIICAGQPLEQVAPALCAVLRAGGFARVPDMRSYFDQMAFLGHRVPSEHGGVTVHTIIKT